MSRRPGPPAPGVSWRLLRGGLRTEAVSLTLVALLVFAASVTAAVAPERLTALADRALRQNVAAAALDDRSLTFDTTVTDTAPSGAAFSALQDALGSDLTPALSRVLTSVSHTYRAFGVPTVGSSLPMPGGVPDRMALVDDSRTAHLVRYVDGVAPEQATPDDSGPSAGHRIAIGVSRRASAILHLTVGATVLLGSPATGADGEPLPPETGFVSGIFDTAAPTAGLGPDDSAFFSQNDTLLTPQITVTSGLNPQSYWAGAFLVSDAGLAGIAHAGVGVQIDARWRRTADTGALTAASIARLSRDFQRFEQNEPEQLCAPSAAGPTSCGGLAGPAGDQQIADGLTGLFSVFRARWLSATALESFGVAALLAVELASVFAAARVVANRRAATVALHRARGASRRQATALLVAESALVIAPATVLGRLVGGSGGQLWPSLLVAVFGLAAVPATVLVEAELGAAGGGRGGAVLSTAKRRTIEGVVAVLAVAAVVSLRSRGVAGSVVGGSVDPMLATVPVLLGAVVAVLAVKAVPPPTIGAARLVGRGRSTAVWLGLARAAERGQTLAVALAVLVLTVAGAVFGGVVVKTLEHGEAASADRLGADAVVRAPQLTADVLHRLGSLPGVRVEPVTAFDRSTVDDDGAEHVVHFVGVGPSVVPGLPSGADPDGSVRVLASPAAARQYPDGTFTISLLTKQVSLRVVGTLPADPPGPVRAALDDPSAAYVVLPSGELAADAGVTSPAVAALYGPVSAAQIRGALADAAPGAAQISNAAQNSYAVQIEVRSDLLATMRSDGLSRSLSGVFEVCAAMAAAFAVVVVILELAGTARERGKTLSFLRTLGLPSRSAAAITVVWLVPTAIAAAVSGMLLGAALPWLLGPALDMTAFTDGYSPPIRVDATVTMLLGGALLALAVAAAAAEAALSRGRRLAGVLRLGG